MTEKHLLLTGIALLTAGLISAAETNSDLILKMTMPPVQKQHALYPEMQKIGIRGASFEKEGKRCFVSGMWQLDVESAPWQHRLFAADVCTYNPEFIYTCYGLEKGADGVKRFRLKENPWYEAIISRFLANRINFWHEHKAGKMSFLMKDPNFKDASDAGHFVAFDPFHPLGIPLYRELYKTWMRYTRNYPVFCYELFNEMAYNNTHALSRNAFREAMKKKFGSVSNMNRAWKTQFKHFDEADAPGFLSDHGTKNLPREKMFLVEGRKYPNLLIDWQKFQEQRSFEAIGTLMPIMRSYDPDPKVFSTIQSHMNWWMDHSESGVRPDSIRNFSDFVSHEIGLGFIECGDYRSYEYAAKMMRPNMIGDLVRGFAPDKPIFNAEGNFVVTSRGVTEEELRKTDLAGLSAGWKFFDATRESPADWSAERADTRKWGSVRVPDMWAKCGYPDCQVGIYRREFDLPEQAPGTKIYLNGKGLADLGEIVLNGEKIGEVKGFNQPFTIDITGIAKKKNRLAIRITNRFFLNGMYYGGIRGFVSVNTARLMADETPTYEPGHYRTYYWCQVMHGMNGIMLSYSDPQHTMAARSIPLIVREIQNTADLVFDPAARPAADVAFLYPYGSMLSIQHRDFLQKLEGPATQDLMAWYLPFVCRGMETDVLIPDFFNRKDPRSWKMIVLPNSPRISKETYSALCRFVRDGGVLVLNAGGMTVDDDSHLPFDASPLTGIRWGGELRNPDAEIPAFGKIRLSRRFLDGSFGRQILLNGASSVHAFRDGTPAVTCGKYGKGRVYAFAGNYPPELTDTLLNGIAEKSGVRRSMEILPYKKNFTPVFVDMKRREDRTGRQLIYLLNYDRSGAGIVKLPPVGNAFRIRNVENNRTIPSPSGKEIWSAAEINRGFPVALPKLAPVVLLMEPAERAQKPFAGISPTRLKMLNELWVKQKSTPGGPVVGLTPLALLTDIHGSCPTAHRLLTDHGFNLRHIRTTDSFEGLDVVALLHPRARLPRPEKLLEFVRNGGGLLLLGGAPLNYHSLSQNPKLMKELGLAEAYIPNALYNKKPNLPFEDALNVSCRTTKNHPVTESAELFTAAGAGYLVRLPENAAVLLRSSADCTRPDKPVAVAFEYGKGRVVFISDFWFLRPLHINRADNAQILLNAIAWLAKKPSIRLTPAAREKALYISRERLEKAEREEKEGVTTFQAPEAHPSILENGDFRKTRGLSGGDPIVDAMKNF